MDNNTLINLKNICYEQIIKIMEHGSDDFREGQVDGILIIIHKINKILKENGEYKGD